MHKWKKTEHKEFRGRGNILAKNFVKGNVVGGCGHERSSGVAQKLVVGRLLKATTKIGPFVASAAAAHAVQASHGVCPATVEKGELIAADFEVFLDKVGHEAVSFCKLIPGGSEQVNQGLIGGEKLEATGNGAEALGSEVVFKRAVQVAVEGVRRVWMTSLEIQKICACTTAPGAGR